MATRSHKLVKNGAGLLLQIQKKQQQRQSRQAQQVVRRSLASVGTTANTSTGNSSSSSSIAALSTTSDNASSMAFLGAMVAAGTMYALDRTTENNNNNNNKKTRTVACETNMPRKSSLRRQPYNVMLHRKRSTRARNLTDKYNVDWSVCLGEGAYGSVHPARLAATGEKVSTWTSMTGPSIGGCASNLSVF